MVTTRFVLEIAPGRHRVADFDPDVGDRDASSIDKDDVRNPGRDSLHDHGAIVAAVDVDDIWMIDQEVLEWNLERQGKGSATLHREGLILGPARLTRAQHEKRATGEGTKHGGNRRRSALAPVARLDTGIPNRCSHVSRPLAGALGKNGGSQ